MDELPLFIFLPIWYIGLIFFIWGFVIQPIKTGEAGSSGVSLRKELNPVKFWISVFERVCFLIIMAILPILIIVKTT